MYPEDNFRDDYGYKFADRNFHPRGLKPEAGQLLTLQKIVPFEMPDDHLNHYHQQMVREFWQEVGRRAQHDQQYYIQFHMPEIMPEYKFGYEGIRLQLRATMIPVYQATSTPYTRVKPPVSATTPVDVVADACADWILRRILNK